MRTRCAVLLAWLAAAAILLPTALAAAPTPASGSAYPWAQPWLVHQTTAPAARLWTQPPATVPIAAGQPAPPPLQSYAWVQPWEIRGGTAPDVGHWTQPPA